MTDNAELLTTEQAAKILAVSPITLRKQRVEGTRENHLPIVPWVKLSPRCVRYRRSDLNRFLESLESKVR